MGWRCPEKLWGEVDESGKVPVCGRVVDEDQGAGRDRHFPRHDHLRQHNPSPAQWAMAYRLMEGMREKAKAATQSG